MRRLLPVLIYYFYKTLSSLWRIRIVEHEDAAKLIQQKKPAILAHWHGDEYALFHLVKTYSLATITSTSKDGDIVDYVIRRLGGETARGSSTRGGVTGLRGLVRLMKKGRITSVAVDGPRGPIYQPKPGVFELSKLCDAPIVPVGVYVNRFFRFEKAWNKAYLPLPFSKVYIYFGKPLLAIQNAQDVKSSKTQSDLRFAIDSARQQASKIIATI